MVQWLLVVLVRSNILKDSHISTIMDDQIFFLFGTLVAWFGSQLSFFTRCSLKLWYYWIHASIWHHLTMVDTVFKKNERRQLLICLDSISLHVESCLWTFLIHCCCAIMQLTSSHAVYICLVGTMLSLFMPFTFTIGPVRFAEICLMLMLMLICCERKTLFVCWKVLLMIEIDNENIWSGLYLGILHNFHIYFCK